MTVKRQLALAVAVTSLVGLALLLMAAFSDMSASSRRYLMVLAFGWFLAAGLLSFLLGKADVLRPVRVQEIPIRQLRRMALFDIGWFFLQGTLVWLALALGDWAGDVKILLIAAALLSSAWALVLAVKLGRRKDGGGTGEQPRPG